MSDVDSNNTRPTYCFYTPDHFFLEKKIVSRSFRHQYDKELSQCIEILNRIACTINKYEKKPTESVLKEKNIAIEKDISQIMSTIQFATDFLDKHKAKLSNQQMEEERVYIDEIQSVYSALKNRWCDRLSIQS